MESFFTSALEFDLSHVPYFKYASSDLVALEGCHIAIQG